MTTTPILGLTELASGQAVPETTVNENTRWVEFFGAGGKVLDRGLVAQPASPADGDAYLLTATPTGTNWSGQGGKIALRISTAWEFKTPKEGMRLYVADEDITIVYDGSAWSTLGGGATSLDGLSDVNLPSASQGDILYRNATEWVGLAAGSSGQVLQTNGAGSNPSWITPSGGTASGGAYRVGGSAAQVGTPASTTETDLHSYTLAAGLLQTDGQALRLHFFGRFTSSTRTRTLRVYVDGVAVTSHANTVNTTFVWHFYLDIVRKSATTYSWKSVSGIGSGSAAAALIDNVGNAGAATWANSVVVKITGQSSAGAVANDITVEGSWVEFLP